MKYPRLFTITISAWGMALLPVYASTDNLTFNGFGSIVATNVLSSDNNASFEEYYLRGGNCPCYITDYYTGGLINEDDGMSLRYESRIGLQLGVRMTDELTFTSQVVARSLTNEFTLEWAYLTYQINDEWSVQAGFLFTIFLPFRTWALPTHGFARHNLYMAGRRVTTTD